MNITHIIYFLYDFEGSVVVRDDLKKKTLAQLHIVRCYGICWQSVILMRKIKLSNQLYVWLA